MSDVPVYKHTLVYGTHDAPPKELKNVEIHCTLPPEERKGCLCGAEYIQYTTFMGYELTISGYNAATMRPNDIRIGISGRTIDETVCSVTPEIVEEEISRKSCPIIRNAIEKSKVKTA